MHIVYVYAYMYMYKHTYIYIYIPVCILHLRGKPKHSQLKVSTIRFGTVGSYSTNIDKYWQHIHTY